MLKTEFDFTGDDEFDMMGFAEALSLVSETYPTEMENEMAAQKKSVAAKPVAPKSTPAKPAGDSAPMVTLEDLAKEAGKKTQVFRQKLRGSDLPKPGARWEWKPGSKELTAARKLLGLSA